jgi:hypothetical protein
MSAGASEKLFEIVASRRLASTDGTEGAPPPFGGDDAPIPDDGADSSRAVLSTESPAEVLPTGSQTSDSAPEGAQDQVPVISAEQVLAGTDALSRKLGPSLSDDEAVRSLVSSHEAKLWAAAYHDLEGTLGATEQERDNAFSEEVRSRFRRDLDAALSLGIPEGWSFSPDGVLTQPNLMQRHVAALVRDRRLVGNWSDIGTGKTVSAVLAARVVRAGFDGGLVLVVCPNNVIDGWAETIEDCYPGSVVDVKKAPSKPAGPSCQRWRVVNFETFSQPGAQRWVSELLDGQRIDMLVIDEVHLAKARDGNEESRRRDVLLKLREHAEKSNEQVRVLVMSATPVVNELFEAKSQLELLKGVRLDDVGTKPTVRDAFAVHRLLMADGIRWRQDKSSMIGERREKKVEIDVGHLYDELVDLDGRTDLRREQVLLEAKLPTIVKECQKRGKTLIYTHYVDGIVGRIREALEAKGLKVTEFSGTVKQLEPILGVDTTGDSPCPLPAHERADVLIGTGALSTGVDGLQKVISRLVFATLPWTYAAYEQVVGRLWRQGLTSGRGVEVVVPVCHIDMQMPDGQIKQWSPCQTKLDRVHNKGALAAAAVDGVRPRTKPMPPTKVSELIQAWLRRLGKEGGVVLLRRPPLGAGPLGTSDEGPRKERGGLARFDELSHINSRLYRSSSESTHRRLVEGPEEWRRYHDLYRQASQQWECVPAHVFGDWLAARPDRRMVADFGCGEMLLAKRLEKRQPAHPHEIHGFDHVAVDERVVACDISHVPLESASVDIAVLSLALMGSNYMDYLREAHRVLRIDGQLWLAETASRTGDDDAIKRSLKDMGFNVSSIERRSQFVVVSAVRTVNEPKPSPLPLLGQGPVGLAA